MNQNPSKENSPKVGNQGAAKFDKRWLLLLMAIPVVGGIIVVILLLTGTIKFGTSDSGPTPTPVSGPTPGPTASGPTPGPTARTPTPASGPTPGPGPTPTPGPGSGPTPGPGPGSGPTPGPGPGSGPTAAPPISIEPESYTASINCVVSSDNPNCYATNDAIVDFTYNQAVDGGASNSGSAVFQYTGYDKHEPSVPESLAAAFNFGLSLGPFSGSDSTLLPQWSGGPPVQVSNNATTISANTEYLGFVVNPSTIWTFSPAVYENIAVNFKFEVYPTANKTTTTSVTTTTPTSQITKIYDFSPGSSTVQYYLVVYASGLGKGPIFANQYPMYMRYRPNGTPYAIVDVTNFMVNKYTAYNVYFYITDKISDLETIYSSGSIKEDENCICYPDHLTVANVAFTELSSTSSGASNTTAALSCVLNSGLESCYSLPSSWDVNAYAPDLPDDPADAGSSSTYSYGDLVFASNVNGTDPSNLSIVSISKNVDGTELPELSFAGETWSGLCTADPNGRGITLQNTSSSPINISLLLEINPQGESTTGCASSDTITIDWTELKPNLYYLVVFTTNGLYANQFPLYFNSYNYTSGENSITMTSANVQVPNLILEDECDLYFCITNGVIDDLSSVYTTSSGSWNIDASVVVASPLQVIVKNVKYVNL